MATPQTSIIPDHCTAAIFMEAKILDETRIQGACVAILDALTRLQARYPEDKLGLSLGFGADFWRKLNRPNEARELKNFRPLGQGECIAPATQHDLLIHIQSNQHDTNFTLAMEIMGALGDSVEIQTEIHGFRRHEERGLDGFVDGTENPQGDEKIRSVAIIGDDAADAGGSYVVLQKYIHDLNKWNTFSLAEQEESMARTKESNEEFSREQRHIRSHIARSNLKENGVGLKIVRRSMPFGTVSGEHGLMFIAYCATLYNIEKQLLSMFGESEDGLTDFLLERLTRAASGAYYFVPSQERLRDLWTK